VAAARALLRDLDALDAAGRITAIGSRMARLGTHPRLARMMCAVQHEGEAALAADLAACWRSATRCAARAARRHSRCASTPCTATADADPRAVQAIRRGAALHRRRLGVHGNTPAEGDAGALLAAGFPDRVALKRGPMDGAFRLASGQGARLASADPMAKERLLAVADLELKGTEARIRMCAPLSLAVLEARFPDASARGGRRLRRPRRRRAGRRRRLFGPLVLEEAAIPHADPDAMARALAEAAASRGFRDLDWTAQATQLRARLARMHALDGAPWPDVSEEALADGAWLAPQLHGMTKLSELRSLDVAAILLPHALRAKLDAALPARVALPGGRSAAVDYAAEVPTLEARAQHLYGTAALPPLAGGRVPLQVALLSRPGGPSPSRATWPDSGKAAGWMRARTCAAATRSMTGRRTPARPIDARPAAPRNAGTRGKGTHPWPAGSRASASSSAAPGRASVAPAPSPWQRRGAHVLATDRDAAKLRGLENIEIQPLDMLDDAAVAECLGAAGPSTRCSTARASCTRTPRSPAPTRSGSSASRSTCARCGRPARRCCRA
jgi:ATP-dependent helicase HrpB